MLRDVDRHDSNHHVCMYTLVRRNLVDNFAHRQKNFVARRIKMLDRVTQDVLS